MQELLATMTLTQILITSFLILVAIKEGISLYKFFKDIFDQHYKGKEKEKTDQEKIMEQISEIKTELKNQLQDRKVFREHMTEQIDSIQKQVNILFDSDRDDIRGYIVEKHNFYQKKQWIDDFSMDVLEKRYKHYVDENGNSYVERMMEDLRALPNKPPMK